MLSRAQIRRCPPVDNFLVTRRMVGWQFGTRRQFDNQHINDRVLGRCLNQCARVHIIGQGADDQRGRMLAGGRGVKQAGHGGVVFYHHAGQCIADGIGAARKPRIAGELGKRGKHP